MATILIIEDNAEVRENTAEILELSNYKVLTAENGKLGVELAKKESPDLIICDVMMPELDGFGVLHILSKNPSTARIPFIFLTAKAEKEDIRKGMELGADDYLTKPFDDVQLLNAIEMRFKKLSLLQDEFKRNSESPVDLNNSKGFKELDQLLDNEKRKSAVSKKHVIFAQGNYPNFLYFIRKGKVKTSKIDKAGNEFITGLYKEGDFLGYNDLLESPVYSESAVALEDSELCMIQKDDFFALVYHNRDVANKFIKILSNNVLEKEERLLRLAYGSVRKRVAESLVMLQKKYQEENNTHAFTMAISRDDLSGLVGASKETVIRTLSDFKEEGLIEISGSKITLVKPDKLAGMRN